MMNFYGKSVLITGGSRGIGKAIALAFAEADAKVAINFVNDNQEASKTIGQMSHSERHIAIKADISIPNNAQQLVQSVVKEFGQIDILVNNAGVYIHHPIDQCTYEQWQTAWRKTMQVNLFGVANLCFCAAQQMIQQGNGRIINISSRGAFRGEPEHTAYGASKAGLNQLSQSLAQALAKYSIFVGVVAPGFVETDMTKDILNGKQGEAIKQQSPLGRVAQPEEIAKAVLFLSSEGIDYMTGAILDVNGASYLRS
jgi:NAD(P)-dependent dehydrogenase (short-subunit alcohol dehydrogenase family)